MEEVLNLEIPGIPTAKQSFKFAIRQNSDGAVYSQKYQPQNIVNEEYNIRSAIVRQLPEGFKPWTGAVMFRAQYVFPPPKSLNKKKLETVKAGGRVYKTTKPDLSDNLNKALCDAMQGVVYINDSQICQFYAEKIYGEVPMTKISMKHLGE